MTSTLNKKSVSFRTYFYAKNNLESAVYGLEVCKAMDLGNDFISQAKQIQLQLLGKSNEIISTKQSNYHKDVYMHKCEVCNKPAEHTHHINEQHNADQHGMLQHYHKNSKFNLIPIFLKSSAL